MNTLHRGSLELHPPFVLYRNLAAASGVLSLAEAAISRAFSLKTFDVSQSRFLL